jgi:hypothetical protein
MHGLHDEFNDKSDLKNNVKKESEKNVRIFVSSFHQAGRVACTHIFDGIIFCMGVWNL